MQVCKECCAVEQGTEIIIENGEEIEVCKSCHFPADECMKNYDEDYGKER
jgi:hypothetical protein